MYKCEYCERKFENLDDCLQHEREHEKGHKFKDDSKGYKDCGDPWGMCIYGDDEYSHDDVNHWLDDEYSRH